jgi:hypothetical protein
LSKEYFVRYHLKGGENIASPKEPVADSDLKTPVPTSSDIFWKRAYTAFCVLLLFLTAGQLFIGLSGSFAGMDYRVYKGAVQSVNHGEDPYYLLNINQYSGEWLPYNYPPHTLLFFWCLQVFFIFENIWIYYVFLIVLLAASAYLIVKTDKDPQHLFLFTLLVTGFLGTFYNFFDGNKDILFLLMFAGIFYLMVREKFWQSSIIMGLMGSFSLITLPFIAIYVVVKRPIIERAAYILLSIGVVAAIFLITWWLTPSLLLSYIENLRGSSSPLLDVFGWATPTPFLMFTVFLNQPDSRFTIPLVLVSLIYAGLILAATWYVIQKNKENPLLVYSFVTLAIFMLLPRIKPYNFVILVPALYFLFRDYGYRIKILVLTVISLVPLLFWYYPSIRHNFPEMFRAGILIFSIVNYVYTVCLILIFVVAFALVYNRPLPTKDTNS